MASCGIHGAGHDVCGGLSAPVWFGFAIGIGLPAVAAAVVVGFWAEHHPAGVADRKRSLPKVELAAVEAALPGLLGWQLGHQKSFGPGRVPHLKL